VGPAFERDRERVLDRVLGTVEIAEGPGQVRERASPLLPEDALDGLYAPTSASRITTGRTSTAPWRADGIFAAQVAASSSESASIR
jgi:hypothetical protein